MGASGTPLQYLAVDENGTNLPVVSVRIFRRMLRAMWHLFRHDRKSDRPRTTKTVHYQVEADLLQK